MDRPIIIVTSNIIECDKKNRKATVENKINIPVKYGIPSANQLEICLRLTCEPTSQVSLKVSHVLNLYPLA